MIIQQQAPARPRRPEWRGPRVQVLTRIPADLATALARAPDERGMTRNALATELLERAVKE